VDRVTGKPADIWTPPEDRMYSVILNANELVAMHSLVRGVRVHFTMSTAADTVDYADRLLRATDEAHHYMREACTCTDEPPAIRLWRELMEKKP
jgi:hypothetical protein